MLKDDGVDPSGGILYSRYERARVERNWRITIAKEQELARAKAYGRPEFQMNMANMCKSGGILNVKYDHNRMEMVTEKDLKQSPQARMSLKGMDPSSLAVNVIKHTEKKPTEKWDMPMSTSHDIGWFAQGGMRSAELMKHHKAPMNPLKKSKRLPKLHGDPGEHAHRDLYRGAPDPLDVAAITVAAQGAAPKKYGPPTSVCTPANTHVLGRTQSAPELRPQSPLPQTRHLNNGRWYRPLRSQDVTIYAETYQGLLHHSPFAQAAAR